ncbi:Cullin repeat-like-containing domain protein [Suillus subalutaceus]|uniref:Cullin repeat-like-containing domain protein n=1 Tax=Suillus subalutaceus TaxID=48586 RepID=UPI001B86FA31|nr:Cullin repeat-like-containing domain protein [Suillus subalutaceus]KAG1863169.1 Cullin repeat-like-containing domain protein [Suillus subalutaceus]
MSSNSTSTVPASDTDPAPPASTADMIATKWALIKQEVDYIMTKPGKDVSSVNWMNLHTSIYQYYSAIPQRDISPRRNEIIMGCPNLHEYLTQYFITDVESLRSQFDNLQLEDEFLLRYYAGAWERYSSGAKMISRIVSSIRINRAHYEIGEERYNQEVLEVHTLAFVHWKEIIFFHLHITLTSVILRWIERQRDGEMINQGLVKNVVDSVVSLGLDVYEEHLEILFLDAAEKYYKPESQLSLAEGNLLHYLTKAGQCLKEEQDRADQYLPLGTRKKLLSKCEYMLIRPYSDLIWETFQRSLDFHKEEVLRSIERFGEHVKMAGLAAVEILLGEKSEEDDSLDPTAYVDTLLEVSP